jgi:hypothetical protein
MEGWIKLHRSSFDHWLYKTKKPKSRREAWEDMLMLVNYDHKKILIRGQLYDCDRGQALFSLDTWADQFNWSIQMVRTFFILLEKDQMITIEGLQYTTRLTVCNYDKYQGEATDEQQTKQQTANMPTTCRQQTANMPLTSTKEDKEVKNVKKGKKESQFLPPTLLEVEGYCLERKNDVDPAKWHAFYKSKGWMVGRNKMIDWRAAVRTWEKESSTARAKSKSQTHITANHDSSY